VLYFSDFDPSGHQMPPSVARKLQALRTLRHPDLQIELHRVALTLEQVRALNLPSTPLKATEKRAKKWRAAMGHEQTEIDALLALRPDEMRRIAHEALRPFCDFTLDQRCYAALDEWRTEAGKRLAEHPARAAGEKRIRTAYTAVQKAMSRLKRAQGQAVAALQKGKAGIGSIEVPAPAVDIKTKPPTPLFTTDDNFVTATRRLIASKALELDEDEP
jgi:hypothetical protein